MKLTKNGFAQRLDGKVITVDFSREEKYVTDYRENGEQNRKITKNSLNDR